MLKGLNSDLRESGIGRTEDFRWHDSGQHHIGTNLELLTSGLIDNDPVIFVSDLNSGAVLELPARSSLRRNGADDNDALALLLCQSFEPAEENSEPLNKAVWNAASTALSILVTRDRTQIVIPLYPDVQHYQDSK